ncbi:hypothetical protein BC829DRAFT_82152 [Chytridium lagenaria]|nr:hypothetical protein BC829DRAFT_82152 [Chytridium lagenaria]
MMSSTPSPNPTLLALPASTYLFTDENGPEVSSSSSSSMSVDHYQQHNYHSNPGYPSHHPIPPPLRARTFSDTSSIASSSSSAHFDPLSPPPVPLPSGLSPSPTSPSANTTFPSSSSSSSSSSAPPTTAPHIDRKPRPWTGLVPRIGANLGAMVISDDTMRGLKYCLQWLQYAAHHIDHQVELLRSFLLRAAASISTRLTRPCHRRQTLRQLRMECRLVWCLILELRLRE